MEIGNPFGPMLPMTRFYLKNSGKALQLPPPADLDGSKLDIIPGWSLLGHTKHPPFPAAWEDNEVGSIAVMFESPDGEDLWWHFIAPE